MGPEYYYVAIANVNLKNLPDGANQETFFDGNIDGTYVPVEVEAFYYT